ncbi:MAG: hypothetical protein R3D03_05675 [Geminicoccaceae bacterium]
MLSLMHDVRDGILADVAPTILDLMHTGQPAEMTGLQSVVRGLIARFHLRFRRDGRPSGTARLPRGS